MQTIDENDHCYDDIINLPHHVSDSRPQMSRASRAAQFSPFAALTGYDAAVSETARLTDDKLEPDEDTKAKINLCLQIIIDHIDEHPTVSITYFKPDERKSGGAYITQSCAVRRIDEYERVVIALDGSKIPIDDIYGIEGDLVRMIDESN